MAVVIRHSWPSSRTEAGFKILYLCSSVPEGQVGLYFWSDNMEDDLKRFETLEEAQAYGKTKWAFEHSKFDYLDADTKEVLHAGDHGEVYAAEESEGRSDSA